jgi:hypothetical protein
MAALAVAFVPVSMSSASSTKAPTLRLMSATVVATKIQGNSAGRATVRIRFCAEIGPRAVLLIRETRRFRGSTRATASLVEPLGVDLTVVMPHRCIARHTVGWLVASKLLVGGGTYSVSIRLRDGRGRVTRSVGFSFRT